MKHTTLFAFLLFNAAIQAQECGSGRYTTLNIFPQIDSAMAVPFGSNTGVDGNEQTLLMDVYMPANDALPARPVFICAFGGSFIAGARGDVADLCRLMAHLGYVAIAPDYRVGFFYPNQLTTSQAVMRCMHDLKGCVRFVRRSKAELADPYHIDPDRIILGGVSAGAVGALHATYMDRSSEILPVLYGDTAITGGIEGHSGSPGYSSDVLACYSFSGALADTSWIEPNDIPLVSVHEVGDPIVPYYTQEVQVFGIPTGLIASGSHDIHVRLDHLGIPNCFLSYPGAQHVGYFQYDPVTSVNFVAQFCAGMVCGAPLDCGTVFADVVENALPQTSFARFDPVEQRVVVSGAIGDHLQLIDPQGRLVSEEVLRSTEYASTTVALVPGAYVVRMIGKGTRSQMMIIAR